MKLGTGVIGGRLPSVEYIASTGNSSSPVNNFSASSQSFGEEGASRQIIVLVYGVNANLVNDSNFTTGVSVGGVSAVRKWQPSSGGILHMTAWITPRQDSGGPTGTSGTIVCSRSTGNGYSTVGFEAFAAYNLKSSDPFDDAFANTGNPTTVAVDLAAGGVITALAGGSASNGTFTWSGATEVNETDVGVNGSTRITGALSNKTTAASGHSISATQGVAANLLALSWR